MVPYFQSHYLNFFTYSRTLFNFPSFTVSFQQFYFSTVRLPSWYMVIDTLITKINVHQENMSMKNIPIQSTCIYTCSKSGVYRGVPIFLIFALQNMDLCVPAIHVLSKNTKNIKKFLRKIFNFGISKNCCI